MSEFDLVVAGGGLSGLAAAIFAARAGKKVLLITRGSGILAVGGGTIDVLGFLPDGTALTSPFAGLNRLPARHPYSIMGERVVRDALTAFLTLTREEDFPYTHDGDANTPVITALGAIKPSYLVPPGMDGRCIDQARRVHVVGVRGLKDFGPTFIAGELARRSAFAGKEICPAALAPPFAQDRDLSTLDLARHLDTEAGMTWLIRALRERIGAPDARRPDVVLLPPLLGTRAAAHVHAAVRDGVERAVCETVGLPTAITGLRLHHLLLRLLKKYGVELIEQSSVTGSGVENGHCRFLSTRNDGRERRYRAKAYIIATGGVLGDGFVVEPTRAVEPIFHLDLPGSPADPGWSMPEAYPSCPAHAGRASAVSAGAHGFALLGPTVDARFRPVDANGKPLCDNVFFVGKALGGYDHAHEKSGNGVAIATAWHAVLQACAAD